MNQIFRADERTIGIPACMDMDIKSKHKYTISSTPVQHRLLIDNLIIHHFLKQVVIFPKLNSRKFKADFFELYSCILADADGLLDIRG
jgi:hypothetical protein